jgi:hypothetical protein
LNERIEPAIKPIPIIQNSYYPIPKPNEEIYSSSSPFPEKIYTDLSIQKFRGFKIFTLSLYPAQYIPLENTIHFYSSITLNIKTERIDEENPLFRGSNIDYLEIKTKIDNPEIADTYKIENAVPLEDEYKYLIITTDDLKNSFLTLKQAHDQQGMLTVIKTLGDDIPIGMDYNDTCNNIRDFIREMYLNNGIEYVLIGGDIDIIPSAYLFFGEVLNEFHVEKNISGPSDLFYSCLDGPYNYNGNNRWGEPDDGENGNDVDLIAEVFVGRACVGNITEVGIFVNKTLAYMSSSDEYLKKVLMVGEDLDPASGWGGDSMDLLIPLIPSDNESQYNISTLYDRDWPDNDWPVSEIISRINNDTHIINHLGHASPNTNMKLKLQNNGHNNINDLTNDKHSFIYSQGCYSGAFDRNRSFIYPWVEECIAEQ